MPQSKRIDVVGENDDHTATMPPGKRGVRPLAAAARRREWSGLPDLAVHLVMKALLPDLTDIFSAGLVCRAWGSVFATCKRALLSSMSPLAVSYDLETLSAATRGVRCYRRVEDPAGPVWDSRPDPRFRPTVLWASHGYLLVDNKRGLFLLEAIAGGSAKGEPSGLISLPSFPAEPMICNFLLTHPPTSPQCVVVAIEGGMRILWCRVGDDNWASHDVHPDEGDLEEEEGAAAVMFDLYVSSAMVAASDGKVYVMIPEGRLLVVDAFFPRLRVSVMKAKGFPLEEIPNPDYNGFMLEYGGDILYLYEARAIQHGEAGDDGAAAPDREDEHRFAALRLDPGARVWVRADGLVADGPRAILPNPQGQSLSWDAGGSGDEGCVFDWCWDMKKMAVYHMRHGFVGHRNIGVTNKGEPFFFLPSACYGIGRRTPIP